MASSGNLLPYRLLPLLLLFTTFLLPLSSGDVTVSYKCLKRGSTPLIAVFAEPTNTGGQLTDLYGKGHQSTCGKSSSDIVTGGGTPGDPFRLLIEITASGNVQDNGDCGITRAGDTVTLTVVIRTSTDEIMTDDDKEANIECDFSQDISAEASVNVNVMDQAAVDIPVTIELSFNGKPSELTVGDDTTLEMTMAATPSYLFKAARPYKCVALRSTSDTDGKDILNDYCPVTGAPVDLSFSIPGADPKARQSTTFKAFRFFDSNTLVIRCIVEVCAEAVDCAPASCSSTGRRKRSLSGGNKHAKMASTSTSVIVKDKDSSKLFITAQLPFVGTLLPISIFIIVILIASVIGLAIKLNKRKV